MRAAPSVAPTARHALGHRVRPRVRRTERAHRADCGQHAGVEGGWTHQRPSCLFAGPLRLIHATHTCAAPTARGLPRPDRTVRRLTARTASTVRSGG